MMTFSIKKISVLCACLMMLACNGEKKPVAHESDDTQKNPALAYVTPEMASRIKTVVVALDVFSREENIPARIEVDGSKVERIGSSVTGRVVSLNAIVGELVGPGQVLAHISSPELTQAQLNYLRAFSQQSLADRAAERARQLVAADVIGAAELQRRESEASVARAETHAAADQLRLLGFSAGGLARLRQEGTIDSSTPVTSTLRGVILERNVSKGQVVQPSDKMFVVADLSSVWVTGGVSEQAAQNLEKGQMVTVDVPALDEHILTGRVVFISDTVDPATRTVIVRTELNNPDKRLKPEMLATLKVRLKPQERMIVPVDAVVRENDRDHVFVKTGEREFKLTPVELGPAVGDKRPVNQGLRVGDVVVAQGAFHLNNERKRAELE
jgi:membrane fusion protein, heavy metal efflux system